MSNENLLQICKYILFLYDQIYEPFHNLYFQSYSNAGNTLL